MDDLALHTLMRVNEYAARIVDEAKNGKTKTVGISGLRKAAPSKGIARG